MTNVPVWGATVHGGKLRLDKNPQFVQYLSKLEGLQVDLVVRKKTKARSHKQNRYYWGVVLQIIADELGYNPEELHEEFKYMFNRVHGRICDKVKSTTDMSNPEFEEYLTKIRQWASADMNIYVPLPNEVDYLN